jgi:hypothetical protein
MQDYMVNDASDQALSIAFDEQLLELEELENELDIFSLSLTKLII